MVEPDLADYFDHMRHGIIKFLEKVEPGTSHAQELLGSKVTRLQNEGKLERNAADDLRALMDLRKAFVYKGRTTPLSESESRRVNEVCARLAYKAELMGWEIRELEGA